MSFFEPSPDKFFGDSIGLTTLTIVYSESELSVIRGVLAQACIESTFESLGAGSVLSNQVATTVFGRRIIVRQEDLQEAEELLAKFGTPISDAELEAQAMAAVSSEVESEEMRVVREEVGKEKLKKKLFGSMFDNFDE